MKCLSEYHWAELWQAVEGLLSFLVGKLDTLYSTGGVELLVNEVGETPSFPPYYSLMFKRRRSRVS